MRDTGDGTAYKVDGVRGGVYVGQAGEARGTKALKDEDGAAARSALDAYRAEVEQAQTTTLFAGSGGDGGDGGGHAATCSNGVADVTLGRRFVIDLRLLTHPEPGRRALDGTNERPLRLPLGV